MKIKVKFKNKRKHQKIKKYLNNLKNGNWSQGYTEHHKNRIGCLEWLLAYYEDRAS